MRLSNAVLWLSPPYRAAIRFAKQPQFPKKGCFRNAKAMVVRMKRVFVILMAAMLLTAGCAKAPVEDVAAQTKIETIGVVAADKSEPALVAPPDFPDRYEKQLSFDGLEVRIDAEVVVPPLTAYPTYILEPMRFTQEQADLILAGLLDGAELYDESNSYNRKYIQGLIDEYEAEIAACKGNPETEKLIPTYEGYLERLYAEYETAPEDSTYTPASRTLLPKDTQVARMLYGTKKVHEDGGTSYEWSKEAARRAAADGYGAIAGVCWQPGGRKMFLQLENTSGTRVFFGTPDGSSAQSAGATFTEAEAQERGAALLKEMGLDFEQLSVRRYESAGVEAFYQLRYRTAVPGTAAANIVPLVCYSETDGLRQTMLTMVPEESVYLSLDNEGVYHFSWDNPVRVKAVEQAFVSLCPWAYIAEIMGKMFGVKQYWQFDTDRDDPMIVGRRIEISKIQLSYMQVMRGNDLSERSYIPDWDICGRLVYCYDAQHSTKGGVWLTDDKNERLVTVREDAEIYSLLTINAIDGTIIDRY